MLKPAFGAKMEPFVGSPARDRLPWIKSGKPLTMIGINMDITARKQAELALQEREHNCAPF